MAATWLNEGLERALRLLLDFPAPVGLEFLRLYTVDVSLTPALTIASFTECTLAGYVEADLLAVAWTIAAAAGVGTADHDPVTFTFDPYGGGTTIYGWYVVDEAELIAFCAERLAVPFAVPPSGGTLTLTPHITDRKLP